MKKNLILLLCLCLLLPLNFVRAEAEAGLFGDGTYGDGTTNLDSVEENNNNADVEITVGNVAVPVYEVAIHWNASTFDWAWNKETKEFGWEVTPVCRSIGTTEEEYNTYSRQTIYSDDKCTTKTSSYFGDGEKEFYILHRSGDEINFVIEDSSENGEIVPAVKWTSAKDYEYVDGKISYSYRANPSCRALNESVFEYVADRKTVKIYRDNLCTEIIETDTITYEENKYYAKFESIEESELNNGAEIPEGGKILNGMSEFYEENPLNLNNDNSWYNFSLQLENTTQPTVTPTAGDTIGTLTITIRAR